MTSLQKVESFLQFSRWSIVNEITNQEGQLVRVLTNRWYGQRSRPVVVKVAHFVRYGLQIVIANAGGMMKDIVVCRTNGPNLNTLRCEEEIVSEISLNFEFEFNFVVFFLRSLGIPFR